MHSWKRSWTGCWPRPGRLPAARYSMHATGQNSGHLPHGQQRFTSMKATSRGRFFFSPISSGASGTRSSLSRRLMTSMAEGTDTSCLGGAGAAIRRAHLRHHVGVLHLAEHRDDDLVVERGALDRLAEDAEVLTRHTRVLDLRQPALVGVRVEEVARLDVGRRRFAPEVLRLGGDAVEER